MSTPTQTGECSQQIYPSDCRGLTTALPEASTTAVADHRVGTAVAAHPGSDGGAESDAGGYNSAADSVVGDTVATSSGEDAQDRSPQRVRAETVYLRCCI